MKTIRLGTGTAFWGDMLDGAFTAVEKGDIDYLWCVGDGAGYVFEWDNTNSKIKAFWVDTTTDGAPLAEVVNTTDLSAVAPYFVIVGN